MMRRWIPSAKGAQRRGEERRGGGGGADRPGRGEVRIICYLTCIINIFRAPTEKQPAAVAAAAAAADAVASDLLPLSFSLSLSHTVTRR